MKFRSATTCAFLLGLSATVQAAPCQYQAQPSGLTTRAGFAAFMTDAALKPFLSQLPKVEDAATDAAMHSMDAMWYDEASMVYGYQDSIEFVVGMRANCVGRVIGELSRTHPQVGKLLQLFGPDYRFMFPFRTAAGTDDAANVKVVNFWLPPKAANGSVIPVTYWQESTRGRWRWEFPQNTLFGEVLYQKAADGVLYPFEVRTRKRYVSGWQVAAFRPYLTAKELAQAIVTVRPNAGRNPQLQKVLAHLQDPNSLEPMKLVSTAFAAVFPAVSGSLDKLPDFGDEALVKSLLTRSPFRNAEGMIWKENGKLETYAASSAAEFSIVPKNYSIGMYPVNEDSCMRCHQDTGKKLGQFIPDISAYGEIWGEDHIFTWHIFEPGQEIYGPYDDNQGSRRVNHRLQQAGLVKKR